MSEASNMSEKLAFFRKKMLGWHRSVNTRQMPWKGEKDPYRIWLSEIILQQTRVEQGWEYYLRFIKKYPSVKDLAEADEKEVFKLWEGLGYYSRCRNLLHSAKEIHFNRNSRFPDNYANISTLKGVGPYTAAAIASFAFNLPHAVVDGNVARVISRYFGIEEEVDSTNGKKIIIDIAGQLLPKKQPGEFNQAIMDHGATVCKPRNPNCDECPLSTQCFACQTDQVEAFPRKKLKRPKRIRYFHFLVVVQKNKVLVRERTEKDIWQNLHEFMLIESEKIMSAEQFLRLPALKQNIPAGLKLLSSSEIFVQQLTHQTIHARFIIVEAVKQIPNNDHKWVSIKALDRMAFPVIVNRWLQTDPFVSAL